MIRRPLPTLGVAHPSGRVLPAGYPHFVPRSVRPPVLPSGFLPVVGVLALVFTLGPNWPLAWLSLAVLVAGVALTWRPGEPAGLLFIFVMQWLEASIAIFMAQSSGRHINELAQLSMADMQGATILSLVGLLVLFAGVRLAAGPPNQRILQRARAEATLLRADRMAMIYVAVSLAALVAHELSGLVPGLRQPLLAAANLKWAAYVALTAAAFLQGGAMKRLFYVVFAVEFVLSLGGYFSSFKMIFIYTFIGLLAAQVRPTVPRLVGAGLLTALAILVGITWSAVKNDFRSYASGGQGQVVLVDWTDRMSYLGDLVLAVDGDALADGADRLARRLTYVEFFGAAMNFVPEATPHTGGALWADAASRPFMPRILFPGKSVVDESALTNRYTGLGVAGWEQGTQISIGYVGEAYIDFGPLGMMVPMALLGLALGYAYRRTLTVEPFRGLLGLALCVPLVMTLYTVNLSAIKGVGGFATTVLVLFAFRRIGGPTARRWLDHSMRGASLRQSRT